MIELRETFWFIVEQISVCTGNGRDLRQNMEGGCLQKNICAKTKRVPSEDMNEDFIHKMNR